MYKGSCVSLGHTFTLNEPRERRVSRKPSTSHPSLFYDQLSLYFGYVLMFAVSFQCVCFLICFYQNVLMLCFHLQRNCFSAKFAVCLFQNALVPNLRLGTVRVFFLLSDSKPLAMQHIDETSHRLHTFCSFVGRRRLERGTLSFQDILVIFFILVPHRVETKQGNARRKLGADNTNWRTRSNTIAQNGQHHHPRAGRCSGFQFS